MLKRYSNTDWRLEELEIKNGPYEALNTDDVMIMVSDVEGDIDVVADGDIFSDTDVGRLIRLRNYDDDTKYWVASKEYKAGDICLSDNKYYEALNSDVSGSNKPVHSVGTKSDGGVRWKYIHDGMGVVKITEYVDKIKACCENFEGDEVTELAEELRRCKVNGISFKPNGIVNCFIVYSLFKES